MEAEREATIRQFTDAWNRRDVEPIAEHVGEDFEYVNPPNALEPGTRRGREGIRTVMEKQWEALGDATQEIERFHHRGELVIVQSRLSRSMPGSTARIDNKVAMSYTFSGDRITRLEIIGAGSSYNDALERAGIEKA